MPYYVYILASKRNGTLYTGMTGNLHQRIAQHKQKLCGFTKRYDVLDLVFVEEFNNVDEAYENERRIKKWRRAWKLRLIESRNPLWEDLSTFLY